MGNLLTSGFPNDYYGLPINSDFRTGIKLSILMDNKDIDQDKKLEHGLKLLYLCKVPKAKQELALYGLSWFITGGRSDTTIFPAKVSTPITEKCIDFNFDQEDIFGAFWGKGIDLENTQMHWFKFLIAINNLGKCQFTDKIGYRSLDINDIKDKDEKSRYSKLKHEAKVVERLNIGQRIDLLQDIVTEEYPIDMMQLMTGVVGGKYNEWKASVDEELATLRRVYNGYINC